MIKNQRSRSPKKKSPENETNLSKSLSKSIINHKHSTSSLVPITHETTESLVSTTNEPTKSSELLKQVTAYETTPEAQSLSYNIPQQWLSAIGYDSRHAVQVCEECNHVFGMHMRDCSKRSS